VFPFNLLNYALGLTRVRFADYLVASIGMLPGTLLYVYYGKLAGDVAALAGGVKMQRDAGSTIVLVVDRRQCGGDDAGEAHRARAPRDATGRAAMTRLSWLSTARRYPAADEHNLLPQVHPGPTPTQPRRNITGGDRPGRRPGDRDRRRRQPGAKVALIERGLMGGDA
jgi:hypothetical protein